MTRPASGPPSRALTGAYCVTNFWEHFSGEKEIVQAGNMARAAKSAGLKHVIWSTFEDSRKWIPLTDDRMPTLQGRFKVAHFDAKSEADHFFTDLGVPTTFLRTSAYWENFIYFGWGPQRGEDGVLAVTFPMGDKKLPSMAVEDISAESLIRNFQGGRQGLSASTVGMAGEHLTGAEIATSLTKALGEEVRYNDVPADVYRGFGFPGADDVGNMFQFKRDCNEDYCGARSLEVSRRLNPELQTLDTWLATNVSRIPIG